ncbi:MAG TPA: hypothetical protein VE860_06255 [Chthoniobacterales bacterium]|nr:hypothetical protein [Chthoniobacterales bacterium]
MRNLISMATGGILLCVVVGVSSCASGDGGVGSKASSQNNGVTVGQATLVGNEFQSPWPFGPLGADF